MVYALQLSQRTDEKVFGIFHIIKTKTYTLKYNHLY